MPQLSFNQYGKTEVRLTQVLRDAERHELVELSVDILFRGDFERSYTDADNSAVLPTDTIKNTVYVIARRRPILAIESFARELAEHFLAHVERLEHIEITVEQMPWTRIADYGAGFLLGGKERRRAVLSATRDNAKLTSGFHGLELLKTSHSAFSGFLKDEFTTLAETDDRLLGTVLDANWTYASSGVDFNAEYAQVRSTLLETFAIHKSKSVQHTLFAMASAALNCCTALAEVHLIMPNKHRVLVNLSKFSLDNPNQIFVPVDQPSGYIEARVVRS